MQYDFVYHFHFDAGFNYNDDSCSRSDFLARYRMPSSVEERSCSSLVPLMIIYLWLSLQVFSIYANRLARIPVILGLTSKTAKLKFLF